MMGIKMSLKMSYKLDDLKMFKVKKILDSKVMLVFNTADFKYYVIKVLQKSSCPIDASKKTTIANNVPYMVKLHKYFESENSVFLVLQFARGGKLWDRLIDFAAVHLADEKYEANPFFSVVSNANLNSNMVDTANRNKELAGQINNCACDCEVPKESTKKFNSIKIMDEHAFLTPNTSLELRKVATCQNYKEVETAGENYDCPKGDVSDYAQTVNLVKNSKRLLNSIDETMKTNDELASNLKKDLMNLETIFEFNRRLMREKTEVECDGCKQRDSKCKRKRSKSANALLKFEKCFSSEDLSKNGVRTGFNFHAPKGECLKLNSANFFPPIPESVVRNWAAEILVALETLHRYNIVCRDLCPSNILLDESGSILLTFQPHWSGVDSVVSEEAITKLYTAPEILSVLFPVTAAVDWWSFGALLHELLIGKTLFSCYPEGISAHTILTFPDFLSSEASSLLGELLKFEPKERLGGGANGVEDIKFHPFFNSIDWQLIYDIK